MKLLLQHPIAFGDLKTNKGQHPISIKILFDSGATSSFLHEKHAKKLRTKTTVGSSWRTGNGTVQTNTITLARIVLPELYTDRLVEHTFHLLSTQTGYDMIIEL
jgi:hypothetical protein